MTCKFLVTLSTLCLLMLASCGAPAPQSPPDYRAANKEVVMRAAEFINARNYEALSEVIAADYLRHSQATPGLEVTTFDQFVEFLRQGAVSFPDDRAIFDVLVAEGDMVAFWGYYEGTNTGPGPMPPTGKFASIEMAGLHRIKDGKIAETWVIWDNMAMFAQLGIVMAPVAPASKESDPEETASEKAASDEPEETSAEHP